MDEYIRRVHFPTERHSVHAIDAEPAATTLHQDRSFVVFPRSGVTTQNELPLPENADTVKPIAVQLDGINEPLLPNSVNISAFVENQTAIDDNGFEPFVYINDDGLFEVKYVPKGENVSQSNDNRQHLNAPSAASINKTEETAIISNDNRQILRDHRISTEANNERSATTTIDLIHVVSPINNTEMIFQWTEVHTKDPIEQQKQQQASPPSLLLSSSSDKNQPRLFNGHPIFA